LQSLCGSLGRAEVDETISGVATVINMRPRS
jgi:hypothetical protein